MCFKNLPIEFDSDGKATLSDTAGDPYGTKATPVKKYVRAAATTAAPSGSASSTTPPRFGGWATN